MSVISVKHNINKRMNPYVTNGLVAMWDGEYPNGYYNDCINELTTWKDLVGNCDLSLQKDSSGLSKVSAENKCIDCQYCYFRNTNAQNLTNCILEDFTFEIVFHGVQRTFSNGFTIGFCDQLNRGLNAYTYNWIFCLGGGYHDWIKTSGKHSTSHVRKNNTLFVYDNNSDSELTKFPVEKQQYVSGDIAIGRYDGSIDRADYTCNSRNFCIRLYNRALTKRERFFNLNIDKNRFGI